MAKDSQEHFLKTFLLKTLFRRLFVTSDVFTRYFFVAFPWLFRGFFVALFCLEKQCLGLFRGFFVAFSWLFRGPRFGQILRVLALEQSSELCSYKLGFLSECTKIARRRSLAIFIADEGIAGNSAARISFTRFHRRKNRGSLAIFFAEEIAHLGASKSRAISPGAVKIAAATAENRAILVHSGFYEFNFPRWTVFLKP